jgi:hypothetical protein
MLATGANIVASAQAVAGESIQKTRTYILVAAVVKSGLAGTLSDPNANFTIYVQMLPLLQQVFQM